MTVSLIAARSENDIIGQDGSIPWHLPADLQHFKRLTTGHTIVAGRKTFQSIGRPLVRIVSDWGKNRSLIGFFKMEYSRIGSTPSFSSERVTASPSSTGPYTVKDF